MFLLCLVSSVPSPLSLLPRLVWLVLLLPRFILKVSLLFCLAVFWLCVFPSFVVVSAVLNVSVVSLSFQLCIEPHWCLI